MTVGIEGGVFSSKVEGGRAGASLEVRQGSARARTPTGIEIEVALAGATLELGGDSGRMAFLRSADREATLFTEDPAFLDALASAGDAALAARAVSLKKQAGARRARGRAGWVVAGTIAAVLVVGVVGGVAWLRGHAVEMVPWEVDEKLGDLGAAQVLASEEALQAPQSAIEIQKIVDKVALVANDSVRAEDEEKVRFEVTIVADDVVNAAALPGGRILVYEGLLRRFAKHGDEGKRALIGVLAHEVSHVMQRHGVAQLVGSVGILALVQLMFGDVSAILVAASAALATSGYSRVHETEADRDAVASLQALGLSPEALARGFELLSEGWKETADGPVKGPDVEMPTILSSHPDTAARVAAARAAAQGVVEKPGAMEALGVDWTKLYAPVAAKGE